MSAENRLHFFRMCAWGMLDPDDLPRHERKVRLRQIRQVIEDFGFTLHVSGDNKKTTYVLQNKKDGQAIWWWVADDSDRFRLDTLHNICRALLPAVDRRFPPTPQS